MVMRPPSPSLPGRPRLLIPVAVLLVLILALLGGFVSLYTDLLWFRSTGDGFSKVFTTVLQTRILLFVVFGLVMALVVGANLAIAYRLRPPFRPMSLEQQNLERYRAAVDPYLKQVLFGASAVFGLFAGLSASGRWETWLLWRHGGSFGVDDPEFGVDAGFYVFDYPFYRFVLGFLFAAIVLSTIAAAVTHYLFGGVRLQTPGEKVSSGARAHLSVLLGLFVLLKAAAYWLDRYGLMFSPRGRVHGASYTDINAVLPAKQILFGVAIICALLFFANIVVRNFALPIGALALLVLAAVVVGGIYPAIVQQFQVKPDEPQREAPYIQRNINATRAAFGIEGADVERVQYDARTTATAATVAADKGTVPNTRLLDPNVLSPTFRQLQQIRGYYGFADPLDIDRYDMGDGLKDYIVAVREVNLAGLTGAQQSWVNEHLAYTHGHGFVAAPANTVERDGRPTFAVQQVPPRTIGGRDLEIEQSRIYFGEQSPNYSIVNTSQGEIDGPAEEGGDRQRTVNYDGDGGVQLGSSFRKLLYALKFRERNILLSGALKPESRIQYIRNPRDRVQKVAPFLKLDADPYPAIIDEKVVWILDGYTTSNGYPYSEPVSFGDVTTDALTGRVTQPADRVNYIRNSVKATVDAYTGEVRLYQWGDEPDPVLEAWRKAFPGIVDSRDDVSDELEAHFRYPEDLFKVQRELLTSYHVTEPLAFFSREDFWEIPSDPADYNGDERADSSFAQPPYYQFLQAPGTDEPQFTITSNFVARNRPNLAAFMTVSSDPDNYGEMRLYELTDENIDGPGTIAGRFESDPDVAESLSLLRRGGSRVILGNLLTLPVGGGLLYIQPVYTQAESGQTYPLLRRVLTAFGDEVTYTATLGQALEELFGRGAGDPATGPTPTGTPSPGATPTEPAGGDDLEQAIADANEAFRDGQEALREGDFAAYGEAQERLSDALERAARASGQDTESGASPSPSPSG